MPAFDRGAEARSISRLHVEHDSGLPGNGAIELRSTDETEIDKSLAERPTRLGLSRERAVDVGTVDHPFRDEDSSEQGSIAADVVHVLPPLIFDLQTPRFGLRAARLRMTARERKWNPPIK